MAAIVFHLCWLFSLAFASAFNPDLGFALFLLAIFPVVWVTIKFGPLFSSE